MATFELTEEEWIEQSKHNSEEMSFFMEQLGDALSENRPDDEKNPDDEEL